MTRTTPGTVRTISTAAAASAVVRLLTDVGEARTLSRNARKAIAVHHDRAAMARATEKVYRELVPS